MSKTSKETLETVRFLESRGLKVRKPVSERQARINKAIALLEKVTGKKVVLKEGIGLPDFEYKAQEEISLYDGKFYLHGSIIPDEIAQAGQLQRLFSQVDTIACELEYSDASEGWRNVSWAITYHGNLLFGEDLCRKYPKFSEDMADLAVEDYQEKMAVEDGDRADYLSGEYGENKDRNRRFAEAKSLDGYGRDFQFGVVNNDGLPVCDYCQGTGEVDKHIDGVDGMGTCTSCGGTGVDEDWFYDNGIEVPVERNPYHN